MHAEHGYFTRASPYGVASALCHSYMALAGLPHSQCALMHVQGLCQDPRGRICIHLGTPFAVS